MSLSAAAVFDEVVGPALAREGFHRLARGRRWRKDSLEIRVVQDGKAQDPYRGAAFTLEFEVSPSGRFEVKLAGRARIGQLLDSAQAGQFLGLRNRIARRSPRPPTAHLMAIPESLHQTYLAPLEQAQALDSDLWLRYATRADLEEWCGLIAAGIADLTDRALTLSPQQLYFGRALDWG